MTQTLPDHRFNHLLVLDFLTDCYCKILFEKYFTLLFVACCSITVN